MKSKTLEVNGTSVACAHEVVHEPKTGHTHIELTVQAGDTKTTHCMTIGSADKPVNPNYGKDQLQADFEKFRTDCANMVESRNRMKTLAQSVE